MFWPRPYAPIQQHIDCLRMHSLAQATAAVQMLCEYALAFDMDAIKSHLNDREKERETKQMKINWVNKSGN